jgi:thiosulfate/3-mercaptopyruvate sulfurtransferase
MLIAEAASCDRVARPWSSLVDVASLAEAIDDPDLVLLDVRHQLKDRSWGLKQFEQSHLPGARFAHVDEDLSARPTPRTGRHPLPDVDAFVDRVGRWGIDARTQVVAYDDAGGIWASRAWWLLRYYGHEAVAVLDGGLPAWTRAGHALTSAVPSPRRAAFHGRPGAMPTVTTWDLTTRAPRCLVDARAAARYRGDEEPVDPVAGHIPGAKSVPTSANLAPDGTFLPREELRAQYEAALAGLPPRDAAFYCGSGVTATHDVLAMHAAGLPGAALYPGSWSEWIRNPLRPVRRGDEP